MTTKREELLRELQQIYMENKISGFSLERIESYTKLDSPIKIVKAFIEPYEVGDSVFPFVPLILMNNTDYIPLVDENYLMRMIDGNNAEVYKKIVEIVNELVPNTK